jgi:hypothetical protein
LKIDFFLCYETHERQFTLYHTFDISHKSISKEEIKEHNNENIKMEIESSSNVSNRIQNINSNECDDFGSQFNLTPQPMLNNNISMSNNIGPMPNNIRNSNSIGPQAQQPSTFNMNNISMSNNIGPMPNNISMSNNIGPMPNNISNSIGPQPAQQPLIPSSSVNFNLNNNISMSNLPPQPMLNNNISMSNNIGPMSNNFGMKIGRSFGPQQAQQPLMPNSNSNSNFNLNSIRPQLNMQPQFIPPLRPIFNLDQNCAKLLNDINDPHITRKEHKGLEINLPRLLFQVKPLISLFENSILRSYRKHHQFKYNLISTYYPEKSMQKYTGNLINKQEDVWREK